MTSGAKREFKRFEGFYKAGTLEDSYIKRLQNKYETGLLAEEGVVKSWFDYCEETYGKIEQTFGYVVDILGTDANSNI